ncbi:hypothetical protein HRbin36_00739 [bacterium HR36]|nr:hypothetical protein HRbin36_00739 [bacterium HR36]
MGSGAPRKTPQLYTKLARFPDGYRISVTRRVADARAGSISPPRCVPHACKNARFRTLSEAHQQDGRPPVVSEPAIVGMRDVCGVRSLCRLASCCALVLRFPTG